MRGGRARRCCEQLERIDAHDVVQSSFSAALHPSTCTNHHMPAIVLRTTSAHIPPLLARLVHTVLPWCSAAAFLPPIQATHARTCPCTCLPCPTHQLTRFLLLPATLSLTVNPDYSILVCYVVILPCSAASVQRAVASQLLSIDPPVQAAALRALKAFKLRYLTASGVMERLLRLADNKTLREELTLFPLARGSEGEQWSVRKASMRIFVV